MIEIKAIPTNEEELDWDWIRRACMSNEHMIDADNAGVPVGVGIGLCFL